MDICMLLKLPPIAAIALRIESCGPKALTTNAIAITAKIMFVERWNLTS